MNVITSLLLHVLRYKDVTFDNGVATLNSTSSKLESDYIPVNGEFWYITFDAYTENAAAGKAYGLFMSETYFFDSNYSSTTSLSTWGHSGASNRITLNEWNIDKMYDNTIENVKNRGYYGPNVQYVKIEFKYHYLNSSVPLKLRNAKIHGQKKRFLMMNSIPLKKGI